MTGSQPDDCTPAVHRRQRNVPTTPSISLCCCGAGPVRGAVRPRWEDACRRSHGIVPTAAPSGVPNTRPRTIKALRPRVLTSHAHRINPVIRRNPNPRCRWGWPERLSLAVAVLQRWGRPERLSRDSLRTENGIRLMGAGLGVGTFSPAYPLESRKTKTDSASRGGDAVSAHTSGSSVEGMRAVSAGPRSTTQGGSDVATHREG
jgi:hypothetical protein